MSNSYWLEESERDLGPNPSPQQPLHFLDGKEDKVDALVQQVKNREQQIVEGFSYLDSCKGDICRHRWKIVLISALLATILIVKLSK
jgi:hypothetical protein